MAGVRMRHSLLPEYHLNLRRFARRGGSASGHRRGLPAIAFDEKDGVADFGRGYRPVAEYLRHFVMSLDPPHQVAIAVTAERSAAELAGRTIEQEDELDVPVSQLPDRPSSPLPDREIPGSGFRTAARLAGRRESSGCCPREPRTGTPPGQSNE